MDESALIDAYLWQTFSFGNVSGLSPAQGLCLVLQHVRDSESCAVEYEDVTPALENTHFVETSSAGQSCRSEPFQALALSVYGTITTPSESTVVETRYLDAVRISLRLGAAATARIDAAVMVLNTPEVSGP